MSTTPLKKQEDNAAAPELLDRAKAFIDYLQEFFPDEPLFRDDENTAALNLTELRAAIAKADEEAREQRAELLNALKKAITHHGESHICGTCQEAKALIIRIEGE